MIENVTQANLAALDDLALKGKQLMVLSSRRGAGFTHIMDPSHHLGSRITSFYHFDNNPFYKPDPRTFEIIEKDHGLKPSECVYVGDTHHDAAAAIGAGLHFIATLESEVLVEEDFADYKVDVFINKFPEVVAAIDKIEGSRSSLL